MITTKDPRCHQGAPDVTKGPQMSSKGPRCLQTVTSRRQRALTPLITPPNHHRRTDGSPDLHVIWRPISVEAPTNCGLPYISTCCIIFFLTLNVCAVANGLSGFVASVSAGAFYLDYTALVVPIYRDVHKKLTYLFYNFHGTKRCKDEFADTTR